jgi:methylmalonyl-CoA mutase
MATDTLFDDFTRQTLADWHTILERDLKVKPIGELERTDADGITTKVAYTSENTRIQPQNFKSDASWLSVQELFVEDVKKTNKEALHHLNSGATSLLFYLYADCNLEQLLTDILLEHIHVNFVVEGDINLFAENLNKLITKRELDPINVKGSVNIDVLESIARTGEWLVDEEADFNRVAKLRESLPTSIKCICVNANLFANAGATPVQQLGTALSMCYEYMHRLENVSTNEFWVNFAIGSDYFTEIAKLRAFRRLCSSLNNALGKEDSTIHLYAETTTRNKTILDRHNNMIRSTSEAMAAIIGGADEVSIKGFDQTYAEPSSFGERIAKNQLSILEHESHLNAVKDIAAGSYFIEELTETLAEKGWAFFQEIEAQGGYVESMKSAWLPDQIQEMALAEQKAFGEQQKVLIGANKHALSDESIADLTKQAYFSKEDEKQTTFKRVRPQRLNEILEKQTV